MEKDTLRFPAYKEHSFHSIKPGMSLLSSKYWVNLIFQCTCSFFESASFILLYVFWPAAKEQFLHEPCHWFFLQTYISWGYTISRELVGQSGCLVAWQYSLNLIFWCTHFSFKRVPFISFCIYCSAAKKLPWWGSCCSLFIYTCISWGHTSSRERQRQPGCLAAWR